MLYIEIYNIFTIKLRYKRKREKINGILTILDICFSIDKTNAVDNGEQKTLISHKCYLR